MVIIKNEQGVELEYEVVEESGDGESGTSSISLRAVSKRDQQLAEDSVEYYEEVIEESEEETESQVSNHKWSYWVNLNTKSKPLISDELGAFNLILS